MAVSLDNCAQNGQCPSMDDPKETEVWLWRCVTCSADVCFSCVAECHQKHVIGERSVGASKCECNKATGKCKKTKKPKLNLELKVAAGLWQGVCIGEVPGYGKSEKQPSFSCKECKISVCMSCVSRCHQGHTIKPEGIKSFSCTCSRKMICLARFNGASATDFNFSDIPPPAVISGIKDCWETGQCTHLATGPAYMAPQLLFNCITCGLNGDHSVCLTCAMDCHSKHVLSLSSSNVPGRCFCANNNSRCRRLTPYPRAIVSGPVLNCYLQGTCTYEFTETNLVVQPMWGCDTCLGAGYSCCLTCLVKCHSGHQIRAKGLTETKTFCDCPTKIKCICCSKDPNVKIAASTSSFMQTTQAQITPSRVTVHVAPSKSADASSSHSSGYSSTVVKKPTTASHESPNMMRMSNPIATKEDDSKAPIPQASSSSSFPTALTPTMNSPVPAASFNASNRSSSSLSSNSSFRPPSNSKTAQKSAAERGAVIHFAQKSKQSFDQVSAWEQLALDRFQCSYTPSDMGPLQSLFECITCNIKGRGVCISCILQCHSGHAIGNRIPSFPCQCSMVGSCICLEKHENDEDPAPLSLVAAYKQNYCTFGITFAEHLEQPLFHCRTCNMHGSKAVCLSCVSKCHAGHDIYSSNSSEATFCYCPMANGICKSSITPLPILLAAKSPLIGQCSIVTMGLYSLNQASFICGTCEKAGDPFEACISCAVTCHDGHEISGWRITKTFCKCDRATCKSNAAVSTPVPLDIVPHYWRGSCTSLTTTTSNLKVQPFFRCKTCPTPSGVAELECCLTCVGICHQGHNVVPIGIKAAHCSCKDWSRCNIYPRQDRCPDEVAGYCRSWNVRYQKVCGYHHTLKPGPIAVYEKPSKVLLDGASPQYLRLKKYFLTTWMFSSKNPSVLNVYELKCPRLSYYFDAMKIHKGYAIVEAFHGTYEPVIDKILEEGLLPPADFEGSPNCSQGKSRVGGTSMCDISCQHCPSIPHEWSRCHMFGLGVYFAVNSSKSDQYTRSSSGASTKKMLVCSLLVGQQDITTSLLNPGSYHGRVKALAGDSIYVRGSGAQAVRGKEVIYDESAFH